MFGVVSIKIRALCNTYMWLRSQQRVGAELLFVAGGREFESGGCVYNQWVKENICG